VNLKVSAEAVLLGTAIAFPATAERILDDVEDADLQNAAHREVLAAIRRLAARQAPCEPLLLADELSAAADARPRDAAHWFGAVVTLVTQASVPASAPHYRRLLRRARLCRDVADVARRLLTAARTDDADHVREATQRAITDLQNLLATLSTATAPVERPRLTATDTTSSAA
jgi:replicative DNA helicase